MSKVGLYAIGTSTILECNKSLYGITPSSPRGEYTLLSLRHGVQSGESSKRNSQLSTYQRFTGHYQQPLGHHAGGGGGYASIGSKVSSGGWGKYNAFILWESCTSVMLTMVVPAKRVHTMVSGVQAAPPPEKK